MANKVSFLRISLLNQLKNSKCVGMLKQFHQIAKYFKIFICLITDMLILLFYIVSLLMRAFRLLFVIQGNYMYMPFVCICVWMHTYLFSCFWLFATPWTVAHRSLFVGFPKQKYCSGLPFPSPVFLCELHLVIMTKYLKTLFKILTIFF